MLTGFDRGFTALQSGAAGPGCDMLDQSGNLQPAQILAGKDHTMIRRCGPEPYLGWSPQKQAQAGNIDRSLYGLL